jgi:hypothetical protein
MHCVTENFLPADYLYFSTRDSDRTTLDSESPAEVAIQKSLNVPTLKLYYRRAYCMEYSPTSYHQ